MNKMTQKEQVLWHLKHHKTLTTWDAIMEYGITRLGSVIHLLRDEGVRIVSKNVTVRTRLGRQTTIAEYSLAPKMPQQTAIVWHHDYNM